VAKVAVVTAEAAVAVAALVEVAKEVVLSGVHLAAEARGR
jgi:hypothetical protein